MNKANSKFYKTFAEVFLEKRPEIIPIVNEVLKADLDFSKTISIDYVREAAINVGCNDNLTVLLAYAFINLCSSMRNHIIKVITRLGSRREVNA